MTLPGYLFAATTKYYIEKPRTYRQYTDTHMTQVGAILGSRLGS